MTYEEGILWIPKQFEYQAEVINKEKLKPFKRIIVLGMGGSRLSADILNMMKPELDIYVHSDFDLPLLKEEALAESLVIANSYSGDTAEIISGAKMALNKGLNLAVVSKGGELTAFATEHGLPHVILPPIELPPRMMLGHDLLALATLIGLPADEFQACAHMNSETLRFQGDQLAQEIGQKIPLTYTSNLYNELGYIWKVMFNETAQIPAFNNRFPELDHNEIAGFRLADASRFHPIILRDGDVRINKRMDATADLFRQEGLSVSEIALPETSSIEQIITSVILAHWTALSLAKTGGVDPLIPFIIEKFKKEV